MGVPDRITSVSVHAIRDTMEQPERFHVGVEGMARAVR